MPVIACLSVSFDGVDYMLINCRLTIRSICLMFVEYCNRQKGIDLMKTLTETLHAFAMGSLLAALFGFGSALWVIAAGQGSAAAANAAGLIVVLSLSGAVMAIFFKLCSAFVNEESNQ
jgi:hypothetical protein